MPCRECHKKGHNIRTCPDLYNHCCRSNMTIPDHVSDMHITFSDYDNNLENFLGNEGIKGLTRDTQNLVAQQQVLMESLSSMAPMMKNAQATLKNFDVEVITFSEYGDNVINDTKECYGSKQKIGKLAEITDDLSDPRISELLGAQNQVVQQKWKVLQEEYKISQQSIGKEKVKEVIITNVDCMICYEDINKQCSAVCDNGHYFCDVCISQYSIDNAEKIIKNKGCCPCPHQSCNAPPIIGINKYLSNETWFKMIENIGVVIQNTNKQKIMCNDQLKKAEDKVKDLKVKLDKKNSELGNQISVESQHELIDIGINRIKEIIKDTQLHCPRCKTTYFNEHTGCQAVKCAKCSCGFCPLCLKDCGKDAHSHFTKKKCPFILNDKRIKGHRAFKTKGRVDAKQAEQNRRREKLTDYLLTVNNPNIRNKIIKKCRQDFIDVNMTQDDINSWIISNINNNNNSIRQLDDETRMAMAIAQSLKKNDDDNILMLSLFYNNSKGARQNLSELQTWTRFDKAKPKISLRQKNKELFINYIDCDKNIQELKHIEEIFNITIKPPALYIMNEVKKEIKKLDKEFNLDNIQKFIQEVL